eukprot:760036-Hanusia_phi.AAC.4
MTRPSSADVGSQVPGAVGWIWREEVGVRAHVREVRTLHRQQRPPSSCRRRAPSTHLDRSLVAAIPQRRRKRAVVAGAEVDAAAGYRSDVVQALCSLVGPLGGFSRQPLHDIGDQVLPVSERLPRPHGREDVDGEDGVVSGGAGSPEPHPPLGPIDRSIFHVLGVDSMHQG